MELQTSPRIADEPRTLRGLWLDGTAFLLAAAVEHAQLDAQVLLCHSLGYDQAEFYLNLKELVSAREDLCFQTLLQRRARHEPVAYIVGAKEFWSLDFTVSPSVLIPRPETELLVELALAYGKTKVATQPVRILDLGTGSGAIAVSLAKEMAHARLWAVDISVEALRVAQGNALRHEVAGQITFLHGDLFAPLTTNGLRFDLIVANPPYISNAAMAALAPEIRNFEPELALRGGHDGLDYYRRMVAEAGYFLSEQGLLLCEIGADQGTAVRNLFELSAEFGSSTIHRDLAGRDRVVAAMKGSGRG